MLGTYISYWGNSSSKLWILIIFPPDHNWRSPLLRKGGGGGSNQGHARIWQNIDRIQNHVFTYFAKNMCKNYILFVRTNKKKTLLEFIFPSLYIGIILRRCQYGFGAGGGSKSRWDGWFFRSAVATNWVSPPYYYGGITRPTEPPSFFSQMPFAIKWQWWPFIRPISLLDIDFSLTKANVSQIGRNIQYLFCFVV